MHEHHPINSFRDLIDRMGGITPFRTALGIEYVTAQKMRQRDSIAPKHWPDVIAHARGLGIQITADDLMRMKTREAA